MKTNPDRVHALTRLASRLAVKILFAALLCAVPFYAALAQTAPNLGTAANFTALAGTSLDCGSASITGAMGVASGGSIIACAGDVHNGDSTAQLAYNDFQTAYISITPPAGDACTQTFASGTITDGTILFPGVYCFPADATFTGVTITLDANGNPNPVWIFKVGTTGTGSLTGTNFIVNMPGVGTCNNPPPKVFWWTAQAATLTDSTFIGTILAGTDISLTRGTFSGRALATNAITLVGPFNSICNCPPITVAPSTLPAGVVNVPYDQTISALGGSAPYAYAVSVGTLPNGLNLDPATGHLSGTPTANGAFDFTITATDSSGTCTGSTAYVLTIGTACPTIMLSASSLPDGTVGVAYNQVMSATGGTAPYSFAVTSGSLPAGLTLSSAGVLSGTPTVSGTSIFTMTATDANVCSGSLDYTLIINPPACPVVTVAPAIVPSGTVSVAYSQTISASGGVGPYFINVTLGTLPSGLALSPSGVLSGTPTASGTSNFTVTAADANGCTGKQQYILIINPSVCPPIVVNPATLPSGTVGGAYSQNISASGGTGVYSFEVTLGSLPAGLALSLTGTLSGVPTAAGTFSFTMTATDANGCKGGGAYVLTIAAPCPTITLLPSSLPVGRVGVAYSQTMLASGGTGPYSFAVTSGGLPAGLTLSSAGVLSGTPTVSGTSSFTMTATDGNGCKGGGAYVLAIAAPCPAITLSPSSLPIGTVGSAYSQALSASGGTGPYTFAVTSGSLPAGLTLASPEGVLRGTPTTAGISTFTVTATDANGCAGYQAYTFTLVNGPVVYHLNRVGPPLFTPPFRVVVKGSNLQYGIKVYVDGVWWPNLAWISTSKIKLLGANHAALSKGVTHQFRFVNPDGGEVTRPWRYATP
ncbi:MAG: putative Ig domain-containing protein [Acidobacteriota bacterium]